MIAVLLQSSWPITVTTFSVKMPLVASRGGRGLDIVDEGGSSVRALSDSRVPVSADGDSLAWVHTVQSLLMAAEMTRHVAMLERI
jgi:hypothetical protein